MDDLDEGVSSSERLGTLHSELLPQLRDYIVEGPLSDGARIPERELCERFGLSRTPLREALKVLAAEGLIELLPNRGARIRALTPVEVGELFDLMGGMEALAGRLACESISDQDFDKIEKLHGEMYFHFLRGERPGYFACNQKIHERIFEAAGNTALSSVARTLQGRLRRVRYGANVDGQGDRWSEAVREHELILDALRRRAGEELAHLMFQHLRSTKDAVLRKLTS